jgi:hypothetical protein
MLRHHGKRPKTISGNVKRRREKSRKPRSRQRRRRRRRLMQSARPKLQKKS